MGVPAYTFVIVCMGALSALAAVGALALALGQLAPRRKPARRRPARRPMMFDPPPAALMQAPAAANPPQAAPAFAPAREPVRRLELAMMSSRAPERLRVPVDLARGRILELSLPVLLANAGEAELHDVSVHLTVPNEISYGASLEHMARAGVPGLEGATVRYTLSESETHIRIDIPRLASGAVATLPAPISIKHAADAAYPLTAAAAARGLEPVRRRYELELTDQAGSAGPAGSVGSWLCRPDEGCRQRDPRLPLDRIASMQFATSEPGGVAAEAAYEPLTL